ncbi:MAG: hypothetical protein JSR17_03860 [Proteobacteria bacterium]|nr:hypothetical protein [Pseudomonadota bacterium]
MLSAFNALFGGQSGAPQAAASDAAYFEPLVFNAVENAAHNASVGTWLGAQALMHYLVVPYLTYKAGQWFFNGRQVNPAQAPGPHVVPVQPAQPKGFFSRMWDSAKGAVSSVAGKFVAPQVVSHSLNQLWLNHAFWEKVSPITTAFMRPSFEKLLPKLYSIWDKGDINFSLRDYIPGGPGTWTSLFTAPLRGVRSVYQAMHGRTFAEKVAVDAYEAGKSFADTVGEVFTIGYDTLASTKKIGPCLVSGPTAAKQCITDAGTYIAEHTQTLRQVSTPLREAAGKWALHSWDLLNSYSGEALNLANQGLWSIAQGVEAKTGIPAHLVYYAELGVGGYLGYKGIKGGLQLGRDYLWSRVLGRGAIQQNNHMVVQQHPPAAQATLAEQKQVVADGVGHGGAGAAPQQQVVVIAGNHGAHGAPGLPAVPGMQQDGAHLPPQAQQGGAPIVPGFQAAQAAALPVVQAPAPGMQAQVVPAAQNLGGGPG